MFIIYNLHIPVRDENDVKEEIKSMPGVYRQGVNHIKLMLDPIVESGLKSLLIFGVINRLPKVINQLKLISLIKNRYLFITVFIVYYRINLEHMRIQLKIQLFKLYHY